MGNMNAKSMGFTEMENRSYLKGERTASKVPKGNCPMPVIYVRGLLASADARLQWSWAGLCHCSGSWWETGALCHVCWRRKGGVGWTEEMSFWSKTWAGLKKGEFLWGVACCADLPTDHEEEGLGPGLSIRAQQNSRAGSGCAKRGRSPEEFANLNHNLARARTVWTPAQKAGGSLERLLTLAHLQFKWTPGRWGGVQINIKPFSKGSRPFFPVNKNDFSFISLPLCRAGGLDSIIFQDHFQLLPFCASDLRVNFRELWKNLRREGVQMLQQCTKSIMKCSHGGFSQINPGENQFKTWMQKLCKETQKEFRKELHFHLRQLREVNSE